MPKKPSILFIRLSSLGDLVDCTRYIHGFLTYWPEAHVELLTSPLGLELFHESPLFKKIHVWKRGFNWSFQLKTLKDLRQKHYDFVFDLHCNTVTGFLSKIVRATHKTRLGTGLHHRLLDIKHKKPPKTVSQMLLSIKEDKANLDPTVLDRQLPKLMVNHTRKASVLSQLGMGKDAPIIVFAPGSSTPWQSKRWPVDLFYQLADKLQSRGFRVVLVGTEAERGVAEYIVQRVPDVLNWTGRTNLSTLVALFSLSVATITNDSGPMHLSAAMGTPTIALFGPTSSKRHGPDRLYGHPHLSLSAGVSCSPCYKGVCPLPQLKCMEGIRLEDVLQAMSRFFSLDPILKIDVDVNPGHKIFNSISTPK